MTAPLYAGIVRVSHMGEREAGAANVHTDREQVADIEQATPPGATVAILPPELNVSGGLPLEKRPSLLAAIEGVEQGKYAGIIVAYLSRLGRNTREQLRAWDRVEAAGGRIICAAENIDTATPSGRFMRTVLLANAEREREEHIERFDNLRRWATEAGVWQRRQVPLGYLRDATTRRLTPSDDAPMVVAAFERRASGESLVSIARYLGMTPQGTRHLLANRVYLGEIRVGQYVNPSAHPPLVTDALFAAVQQRKARPARGNGYTEPALLAGLIRCAGCGHVMSRRRGKVIYYGCAVNHSGQRCPAPASVTLSRIDGYVDKIARATWNRMVAKAHAGDNADAEIQAVARADAEFAAYVAVTSALDDPAFMEGAQLRKRAADEARAALEAKQATLRQGFPDGIGYDDLTVGELNRWLHRWVGAVVVERSGGRGIVRPIEDRVLILDRSVAGSLPHRSGSEAMGIHPLPLADFDGEAIIRVFAA